MSDQEQLIKWQAEFINEFKINPFHMGRDYLLKMSDLNPTEFDEQTIQAKWLWYLAARKAAQVEYDKNHELCFSTDNCQLLKEIEQLKQELQRERECVDFYANKLNWRKVFGWINGNSSLIANDTDYTCAEDVFNGYGFGGKRAREVQAKRMK